VVSEGKKDIERKEFEIKELTAFTELLKARLEQS
jgi:hypothetical protein